VEYLQNLERIRTPLPAIFANKLPPVLHDANLESVDRYDPVIKVADSSPLACNRGMIVFSVGGAERFCLPTGEILVLMWKGERG
jgi:hypothetical protein